MITTTISLTWLATALLALGVLTACDLEAIIAQEFAELGRSPTAEELASATEGCVLLEDGSGIECPATGQP